jgi:hypothetical protein
MNTLITLFPLAGLLIICFWLFYGSRFHRSIKNWYLKVFTKERVIDFFCNWTERINDHYELY